MKKVRIITVTLLLLLFFTSCTVTEQEQEIEMDNIDTGITVATPTTSIKLIKQDNTVYISSLQSASGYEYISAPAPLPLPSDFEWTYEDCTPYEQDGNKGCTVRYFTSDRQFEYRVYLYAGIYAGPCETFAELINHSDADYTYKAHEYVSFGVTVPEGSSLTVIARESGTAEGINVNGTLAKGSGIKTKEVAAGNTRIASTNGNQNWNANGYIPVLFTSGQPYGFYMALEWTHGYVYAECDSSTLVHYSAALGAASGKSEPFRTVLQPDECFVLPVVYIGAFEGSLDDGSNNLKNWYLQTKAPVNTRENENEPLTQMDMQKGIDVADWGVQAIKWEYGWWGTKTLGDGNSWRNYEGSWVVRHPAYLSVLANYGCETLKEFTDKAKANGLTVTMYVLWHDTLDENGNPTDAEGEFNSVTHPDWFSNRLVASGMGNSADLGNEECVAYLQKAMLSFFKDNGITTWRSDFEPICTSSDKENRHSKNGSDCLYWNTVGFGEILEYLIKNYPGFRYESCCSGGAMKGYYTGKYAACFNTDDSANYLSNRATFYDSSYCIHPVQLHNEINPDTFIYGRSGFYGDYTEEDAEAVMHMGMRSLVLAGFSTGSWTGDMSSPIPELYTEYYTMFNEKLKPLIRHGNLYHILPRPDGTNWDGVMYADPDTSNAIKGAAFLFKPSDTVSDTYNVVMAGLDENTTYRLVFEDRPEQNTEVLGKTLMTDGITVTIEGVGSEIIWLY